MGCCGSTSTADPTNLATSVGEKALEITDEAQIQITFEEAVQMKECLSAYPVLPLEFDVSGVQTSVGVVADILQGTPLRLSIAARIELLCRAVANTAIKLTDGTDVGIIFKKLMDTQNNSMQKDIQALREKSLKIATNNIQLLTQLSETLLKLEAQGEESYKKELKMYTTRALEAEKNATDAFFAEEGEFKLEEKVRATTLWVSAIMATTFDPERSSLIVADTLTNAVKTLFDDDDICVLISQECGSWQKVLCFKEKRQRRLREAFQCLMHAEAWIAKNAPESPTILSRLSKPFDMNRIIEQGILDPDRTTLGELAHLAGEEEYTDKEFGILQSYCGQKPEIDCQALSGSEDNSLKLWQVSTGTCLRSFTGHEDSVTCVTMAGPDQALSGSLDSSLKLWQVSTGTCLRSFTGHEGYVFCVTMAGPDQALSGSLDNSLKLWQVSTGTCLRSFTAGHKGFVFCVTIAAQSLRRA